MSSFRRFVVVARLRECSKLSRSRRVVWGSLLSSVFRARPAVGVPNHLVAARAYVPRDDGRNHVEFRGLQRDADGEDVSRNTQTVLCIKSSECHERDADAEFA